MVKKSSSFLVSLLGSLGLKRLISSFLSAILPVVASVPALSALMAPLQFLASAFGVAGVGHAMVSKTLNSNMLTTLASVCAALIMAASSVPQIAPFLPVLHILSALLGAMGFGAHLKSVKG